MPVRNECEALEAALEPLRDPRVERIVVDGDSSDGSAARARALGAEQVIECRPGRSLQLAAGLEAAQGPAVLFLHVDTRLESGWPTAILDALRDPSVAGGAFRLRFESRRAVYRMLEWGVALRSRVARLPYGDQALFARREVLERVGIPPTPIFEDLDLVVQIRRAGRLVLLRQTAQTSPRRYERNGVLPTVVRNNLALAAWLVGLDRERVARWYRGTPRR
ncbi:MAG: TIGR04283 family arsenosugar biosynthesis glycosyltransferase [Myxococcota bacterium]